MALTIQTFNPEGTQVQVEIDRAPDECPICHRSIQPVKLGNGAALRGRGTTQRVEVVWRCPSGECERIFIGRYSVDVRTTRTVFVLVSTTPRELFELAFNEAIENVSPDFCVIYRQADKAERLELKLVAGPGYRKALEFLVKDFLLTIYPDPTDQKNIRDQLLGSCIENYVKTDKIKETAKRAAWLGNDETHFIRKWEDKDMKDLKDFIQLAVYWIEQEILYSEMLAGMPPKPKA